MRHDKYVIAPLQLHDDRLQADNDIAVRFATPVAVVVLVFVAGGEIFRVGFGDFRVCEAIAGARVEFVQGFPFELRVALFGGSEEAGSLDGATEGGSPDRKSDIIRDGLGDERREGPCVKLSTW